MTYASRWPDRIIAVGKSFVTSVFEELGAHVIDADQTAREVVMPGTPGLEGGDRGVW